MEITTISCLIIDDDDFARETLQDFLSTYSHIEVIKTISESQTAIKYIATLKPDLVFLDINMPEKNGISVMNEIIELNIQTEVIFITAHKEYLMDALKRNAFDYLVKPINHLELKETIERFVQKRNDNPNSEIVLRNSHRSIYLKPENITYINADGCYTNIHLIKGKTETISKNIGSIEDLFPSSTFYRISRSVIINLKYISKINRIKRMVYLNVNDQQINFKASKERLYDLEALIQ